MVILWISLLLVCAVAIGQGDASRAEVMQDFYQAEYRHCYPVDT